MVKNAVALLSLLVASTSLLAAEKATVAIEVSGLAEAEGNLYVAVYDNPDDWLGDEKVSGKKVAIAEARVEGLVLTSIELPPGDYAFSIFYDANDNGELDTNFIGIPKEPVALSNNARPKFGPPKYKDAVFSVPLEGVTQQISIEAI